MNYIDFYSDLGYTIYKLPFVKNYLSNQNRKKNNTIRWIPTSQRQLNYLSHFKDLYVLLNQQKRSNNRCIRYTTLLREPLFLPMTQKN